MIASCDTEGRILLWDPKTGGVTRPKGLYKHKINIAAACGNSHSVYTQSGD